MKRILNRLSVIFRMFSVLLALIFFFSPSVWAQNKSTQKPVCQTKNKNLSKMCQGTVMKVIDAGRYTYLNIDTGSKRIWVAAQKFDGKSGDIVLVPPGDPVAGFHSNRLNRDFDMIFFVGGVRTVEK